MLALKILISVLMAFAGGAKLAGAKPIAQQFEEFGLPRAMMFLVGGLEVAAGIGVHIGALAFFASTGLALLMVGALAQHVKARHPVGKSIPALVVLLVAMGHSVLSWDGLGGLV